MVGQWQHDLPLNQSTVAQFPCCKRAGPRKRSLHLVAAQMELASSVVATNLVAEKTVVVHAVGVVPTVIALDKVDVESCRVGAVQKTAIALDRADVESCSAGAVQMQVVQRVR